jgi:hypothetical protein
MMDEPIERGASMALVKLQCVQYGNYFINPSNITFISCGKEDSTEDGTPYQEIFLHFVGGVESAMLMVKDVDEAVMALGS